MTTNFDAALAFRDKGYNVVPQAAIDKKYPAVKWKGLQDRLAEPGELEEWKHLFENGVGFITGGIGGVIVTSGWPGCWRRSRPPCGYIEMRPKEATIADKIFRGLTTERFRTRTDPDVIFVLLDKYFNLRWS
jgi:hypothetical protein